MSSTWAWRADQDVHSTTAGVHKKAAGQCEGFGLCKGHRKIRGKRMEATQRDAGRTASFTS